MKIANHLLSRHGRMFLVLMLVFASTVPGSLHAAAMAVSGMESGSGHHSMEPMAGDQPVAGNHHAGHAHSGVAGASHPASPESAADPCCPATCALALCSFVPLRAAVFVPDSFEIDPIYGLVIAAMALPERPPRA